MDMKDIWQSASKILLLAIGFTACASFLFGKMDGQDFMTLASMVFLYYFSRKKDK